MSTRELKAGRRMRKLDICSTTPALSMSDRKQSGRAPDRGKEKQEYQKPFQVAARSHH